MHHDPLRSTQKRPFFVFGHNFVVLSLQVALPFAPNKYWAFSILVRMYRKRQTNQRDLAGEDFQRPCSGCAHPKTPPTLCGMGENADIICKTLA